MTSIDTSDIVRRLNKASHKAISTRSRADYLHSLLSTPPAYSEQRKYNAALSEWFSHHEAAAKGWTRLLCYYVTQKLPRALRNKIYEHMHDYSSDGAPNSAQNLYYYSEQVVREMMQMYYFHAAWEVHLGTQEGTDTLARLTTEDGVGIVPAAYAVHITILSAKPYDDAFGGATGACYRVLSMLLPKLNAEAQLILDVSATFPNSPTDIQRGMRTFWDVLLLYVSRGVSVAVATKLVDKSGNAVVDWVYEMPKQVPEFYEGDEEFGFRNKAQQEKWLRDGFAEALWGVGVAEGLALG